MLSFQSSKTDFVSTKAQEHTNTYTQRTTVLFVLPPCQVRDPLQYFPYKNEKRCVADTSNAPLNFKSRYERHPRPWMTCVACCPARTPLGKCPTLSLDLVKGEMRRNGSNTQLTPCPCLLPFNSCLYRLSSLGCSPLLSPLYFFSNYLSAQKLLPIWSAINYRLLIRQRGGKSMSVQVCFNLTEDFMIERCKLIGFLTGCLDKIATLSKRD